MGMPKASERTCWQLRNSATQTHTPASTWAVFVCKKMPSPTWLSGSMANAAADEISVDTLAMVDDLFVAVVAAAIIFATVALALKFVDGETVELRRTSGFAPDIFRLRNVLLIFFFHEFDTNSLNVFFFRFPGNEIEFYSLVLRFHFCFCIGLLWLWNENKRMKRSTSQQNGQFISRAQFSLRNECDRVRNGSGSTRSRSRKHKRKNSRVKIK